MNPLSQLLCSGSQAPCVPIQLVSLPPDSGPGVQGLVSSLRVHAEAFGEEVSTAPPQVDRDDDQDPDAGVGTDAGTGTGTGHETAADQAPGTERDEGLVRTGVSTLMLLAAALLSMALDRMLLRARRDQDRRRRSGANEEVGP